MARTAEWALLGFLLAAHPAAADDWTNYGGAPGGGQYTAATEITPANVHRLSVAWVHRSGDFSNGGSGERKTTYEANPIYANDLLYVCTPYNRVVAIRPETGETVWSREPFPNLARDYDQQHSLICRGVSFWTSGGTGACENRIVAPVLDGRVMALDADTGAPCRDFGTAGYVDLNKDFDNRGVGVVNITSPPVIHEDLAIFGTAIGDNQNVDMPDGTVRALDVRTGRERWSWNPIPAGQRDRTGAANAWAPMSIDPETGILFVPTSSPSPDYWGGDRAAGLSDTNAVVALDAATGRKLWSRQIVHHDLFDLDMPAQPVLVDRQTDGRLVPGVAQVTKTGSVYLMDRRTGAFLFDTPERPVPRSDVAGEASSPTQPVPTLPPPIARQAFTASDAWGLTPIDRDWCRDRIREMRTDGLYTPPSLAGSVQMPFYGGGSNWGGMAYDPVRRLIVSNVMNLAQWVRLVPRDGPDFESSGELGRQKGAPYMMRRGILLSPLGIPCNPPPWGEISAIDVDSGAIRWRVPLGRVPLAMGIHAPSAWGSPNIGGPMATATGLVFIAATMDATIRAFNSWTGEEIWRHDLPFDGAATPMSFVSRRDGRQYIVIAAGGSALLRPRLGDTLVAFALDSKY